MIVECITDTGAVRKSNEDAVESGILDDKSAWVAVCDGMGGVHGGGLASSVAIKEIKEHIEKEFVPSMSSGNIKAMMNNAISKANEAVFKKAEGEAEFAGMGTTAVIMVTSNDKLHVLHVGDSRAYLMDGEELERLTMDHSYVQNLINFGQITEEDAKLHPQRNIITKVIGVHEHVAGDYVVADFKEGCKAVACTDGLTNHVDDNTLFDIMLENSGKDMIEKLVAKANENGGSDNITVALLEAGA